jgi:FkbM family methyltransferase
MRSLRNAFNLVSDPKLARDYLRFRLNKIRSNGEIIRQFPEDNLTIGGLSGFSEFHSCANFISNAERKFLNRFSFADGPIIDVGANLGIFSLLLARRFPDRIIYAFEPNPSTFEAMRANLSRNRCPKVQAHQKAIASSDGEISFQANPVDRATTHIVVGDSPIDHQEIPIVHVPSVTLDSFIESQPICEVALLKVDVEGYEEIVFKGAERLLSTGIAKTIYYEVDPARTRKAGFDPAAASRRLLAHRYKLHTPDDSGRLRPVELSHIEHVTCENWVAIK